MKRVILLLFPLLLSHFISAQTESLNTISKPINSDYFNLEEEEKFFLHTNKTTYFTGERVWWKAYIVQDINEKPSTNTSNLYVNFYNPEKKLISHQLFFCDNGTSNGEIELPEDLKSGTYYITLDTQWNRNYNNPYTTSIQVINTKTNNSQTQDSIASVNEDSENITVEFYPESGALLENIKNTVYFNIKNNGKYIPKQTVKIINTTIQKQKLQTKTNPYGHGQFDFVYNSKNNYSLEFNYNNKDYHFTLNTNTDSGIVIHKEIKATESSQEKFVIKFSEEVVKKHHGEKLYTIVHRNQKPIYIKAFEIDKQYLNYGLPIEKRELFNGVNTLTIFNTKNQPLAERHFFIQNKKPIDLDAKQVNVTKDSVTIDFKLKDIYSLTNLSISLLPSEFKLNNNPNTILDDFLINSYTKERLPNTSQLNSNEIDLFLQTQTKPTLKNKFKDKKPFFTPERGLTIHGAVNANSEGQCKILLTSKENEIIEFAPLKADKTFTFNNLILNNTSNYNLSLINENGELINAAFFIYNSNKSYKPDSLLVKNKSYLTTTNSKKTNTYITPNYNISYQNAEILEEVVLEGKSKTNKNLYPKLPTGPGTNFFKKLNFDEKDAYNFTVIEYLNNQSGIHAFDQAKIDRSEGFEKVDYISVIFRRNRAASLYGSPEALILIDGLPVDNEILKNMRLNQVESIELNPNGSGYGFRGGKGVVAIQLKKGGENKIKTSGPSTSYTSLPDFGYTGSSPYYFPPALIFNTNTSQRFYETLDWVPNYNVLPNMSNELKLYKGDHDNVTLFINGMNKNGGLVYKEVEIPL